MEQIVIFFLGGAVGLVVGAGWAYLSFRGFFVEVKPPGEVVNCRSCAKNRRIIEEYVSKEGAQLPLIANKIWWGRVGIKAWDKQKATKKQ